MAWWRRKQPSAAPGKADELADAIFYEQERARLRELRQQIDEAARLEAARIRKHGLFTRLAKDQINKVIYSTQIELHEFQHRRDDKRLAKERAQEQQQARRDEQAQARREAQQPRRQQRQQPPIMTVSPDGTVRTEQQAREQPPPDLDLRAPAARRGR
jgi:hypothetical protein